MYLLFLPREGQSQSHDIQLEGPRLLWPAMRIKTRRGPPASKGWKGTKSQRVQFPGIITQTKTALPHSCPVASFAFLLSGQALIPSDQVDPAETRRGHTAGLQLHRLGWASAGCQAHLNGNKHQDGTTWPSARRSSCLFRMEGNFAQKQQNELSLPTDK